MPREIPSSVCLLLTSAHGGLPQGVLGRLRPFEAFIKHVPWYIIVSTIFLMGMMMMVMVVVVVMEPRATATVPVMSTQLQIIHYGPSLKICVWLKR